MNESSGTEASDDRITESKRTKYTDATKRANVTHDYYGTIAALEAEEAQLLRDLRAIRGQIEEEKRKLERGE